MLWSLFTYDTNLSDWDVLLCCSRFQFASSCLVIQWSGDNPNTLAGTSVRPNFWHSSLYILMLVCSDKNMTQIGHILRLFANCKLKKCFQLPYMWLCRLNFEQSRWPSNQSWDKRYSNHLPPYFIREILQIKELNDKVHAMTWLQFANWTLLLLEWASYSY
jgi:hypothetical protein